MRRPYVLLDAGTVKRINVLPGVIKEDVAARKRSGRPVFVIHNETGLDPEGRVTWERLTAQHVLVLGNSKFLYFPSGSFVEGGPHVWLDTTAAVELRDVTEEG